MTKTFEERYEECGAAFGRVRMGKAQTLAERLRDDFPREPQAWFMLNLVVCLRNTHGGPFSGDQQLPLQAKRWLGDQLPPVVLGDMWRDQAICLITFAGRDKSLRRHREAHLKRAGGMIADLATGAHAEDPNRLTCLHGIRGRLAFARGGYNEARAFHREADSQWKRLGADADRKMRGLNLVHGLRATVAVHGRKSDIALEEFDVIRREYPDELPKAGILMRPMGLFAFRQLMLHR